MLCGLCCVCRLLTCSQDSGCKNDYIWTRYLRSVYFFPKCSYFWLLELPLRYIQGDEGYVWKEWVVNSSLKLVVMIPCRRSCVLLPWAGACLWSVPRLPGFPGKGVARGDTEGCDSQTGGVNKVLAVRELGSTHANGLKLHKIRFNSDMCKNWDTNRVEQAGQSCWGDLNWYRLVQNCKFTAK